MRKCVAPALCALVALAYALMPVDAFAQSSQGGLRGVVKDAQGVIPGVTVTLINEATGIARETVTNEIGEYSFPAVDPATYTVKCSVQGFKTFERHGVRISTQQFVGLDVVLEVGTLEETITVTADAPLIESTNASIGGVVDAKTLESIPTAGRSVFLMATLEPTVQASGNAHWNRMQDQVGNSAISMGGGPVRANNFLVDGFPVTDLQNRASTNPSMEAVQEMKVQVHTYDAEMGRTGGGVMNMSARSGRQRLRGLGLQRVPARVGGRAAADSEAAGPAERAGVLAQRRRRRRRPDHPEQDVLLGGRREVRQQPAAAELVPGADHGGAERRLLRTDAQRRAVGRSVDPLHAASRSPATSSRANRINPVGARSCSDYFPTPDTEVDNGSHELQHDRPAAEQGVPVHDQGRSQLQQRGRR